MDRFETAICRSDDAAKWIGRDGWEIDDTRVPLRRRKVEPNTFSLTIIREQAATVTLKVDDSGVSPEDKERAYALAEELDEWSDYKHRVIDLHQVR